MKNNIKILLAYLLFTQAILAPRFDVNDCLDMASQADAENNRWLPTDRSRQRVQNIIHRMRNCNCAERAKKLDKYTDLHRRIEKKCAELVTTAQYMIDTWFPTKDSRKQAIVSMQIAEALGSKDIARDYSLKLHDKCYEIIEQENKYHRQVNTKENIDRLELIRLLKRTCNCY